MVGPTRPQFVLFGSSIVQFSFSHEGWGATLADIYSRKADIFVRGYAGWNSRMALQVLDKIFPKDAIVQPSLVIVYFGGNDSCLPHPSGIGPHVPLIEYVENMKKIALYLKSLSDSTRVIFLSSPPVNEEQTNEFFGNMFRTNDSSKKYADACVELCQEMGIEVVNLYSAIQRHKDWLSTCFTDGIHLTSEGSKIVVEEILKIIANANWEPSLNWKSMPAEFDFDSPNYSVGPDGETILNPSNLFFSWQARWARF